MSTRLHFSKIAITWNVVDTNSFRIGYAIHSRPSMYPTVLDNVDVATIANPLLTIGNYPFVSLVQNTVSFCFSPIQIQ